MNRNKEQNEAAMRENLIMIRDLRKIADEIRNYKINMHITMHKYEQKVRKIIKRLEDDVIEQKYEARSTIEHIEINKSENTSVCTDSENETPPTIDLSENDEDITTENNTKAEIENEQDKPSTSKMEIQSMKGKTNLGINKYETISVDSDSD